MRGFRYGGFRTSQVDERVLYSVSLPTLKGPGRSYSCFVVGMGKGAITLQSMLSISEAQIACLLERRQRVVDTAECVLVTKDIEVADSVVDELRAHILISAIVLVKRQSQGADYRCGILVKKHFSY